VGFGDVAMGRLPAMQLDSARELKAALHQWLIVPMATSLVVKSAGLRAQPTTGLAATPPTIALGVVKKRKNHFGLAVRVQKRGLENGPQMETIRKRAKGEVDVRYIGEVTKRAALPWYQKMTRPLRNGASIGHFKITAGTLGGFVRSRDDGSVLILSNNHVLANENRAKKGDHIIQPGTFDGGQDPGQKFGELLRFVKLKKAGVNLVDCAVASIDREIKFNHRTLTGLGKLAGLGDPELAEDDAVGKVGRTTGTTKGRVTAFELDNVVVGYDIAFLKFDGQVEIEGVDSGSFSQGGDSGSLIVDAGHRAVALLFAGSDQGGSNGHGLTFANPIRPVLDALKVDLDFA
jgi:hypothetical protein